MGKQLPSERDGHTELEIKELERTNERTKLIMSDEDEEPVDKLKEIHQACIPTCPQPLANYEECKQRIQQPGKQGQNCEIWYYELHHCIDKCVAPKIFAVTKE